MKQEKVIFYFKLIFYYAMTSKDKKVIKRTFPLLVSIRILYFVFANATFRTQLFKSEMTVIVVKLFPSKDKLSLRCLWDIHNVQKKFLRRSVITGYVYLKVFTWCNLYVLCNIFTFCRYFSYGIESFFDLKTIITCMWKSKYNTFRETNYANVVL